MTIFEYPELKRKYAALKDVVALRDVQLNAKDAYISLLESQLTVVEEEREDLLGLITKLETAAQESETLYLDMKYGLEAEIRELKDTIVRMAASSAPAAPRPTGNQVMGMLNEMLGGLE